MSRKSGATRATVSASAGWRLRGKESGVEVGPTRMDGWLESQDAVVFGVSNTSPDRNEALKAAGLLE